MADNTIVGATLDGPKERDAIHVAVAPVIAAERLYPGQHIGLASSVDKESVSTNAAAKLGIVDPFLTHYVEPGTRFWMFLYPNTITALKHVWTHPAFGADAPVSAEDKKAASERWLRDFVAGADCPSYETVIAAAIGDGGSRQWDDEYLHFDGSDAHGSIPAEFWDHVEVVTGRKIEKRASYFSCSC